MGQDIGERGQQQRHGFRVRQQAAETRAAGVGAKAKDGPGTL